MSKIYSNSINRDFSDIGRSNVISSNAMLASSHPIASSVGIEILKNGGKIKVIRKPGVGHHPHSLKDPTEILDFLLKAN